MLIHTFSKGLDHPQNARKWGLFHEDSARNAYHRVESKKYYKLNLLSKKLLICKAKPMIGASVDNIRTCKCDVGLSKYCGGIQMSMET